MLSGFDAAQSDEGGKRLRGKPPLPSRNGSAASPPPQRKPMYGPRGSPCCRFRRGVARERPASDRRLRRRQRRGCRRLAACRPQSLWASGTPNAAITRASRVIDPASFHVFSPAWAGGVAAAAMRMAQDSAGIKALWSWWRRSFCRRRAHGPRLANAPRSPPPVLRLWPTGASDVHAAGVNRLGSLALRV